MIDHTITIVDSQDCYRCSEHETVLTGMERLGKRGIPVGCRGGGCGVCKVHITHGRYSARKMSRACVSAEEEDQGYALACRIHPSSDLTLNVVGKMIRALCGPKQTPVASGFAMAASANTHREET